MMRESLSYAFRHDLLISDLPSLPDLRRLGVMAAEPFVASSRRLSRSSFRSPASRSSNRLASSSVGRPRSGSFLQFGESAPGRGPLAAARPMSKSPTGRSSGRSAASARRGLGRDVVAPARAIRQAARQQQPQPVGPARRSAHGHRIAPRVVRRPGRSIPTRPAGTAPGRASLSSGSSPSFGRRRNGDSREPERRVDVVGFRTLQVRQRVDVRPDVPIAPDAVAEPADQAPSRARARRSPDRRARRISPVDSASGPGPG